MKTQALITTLAILLPLYGTIAAPLEAQNLESRDGCFVFVDSETKDAQSTGARGSLLTYHWSWHLHGNPTSVVDDTNSKWDTLEALYKGNLTRFLDGDTRARAPEVDWTGTQGDEHVGVLTCVTDATSSGEAGAAALKCAALSAWGKVTGCGHYVC